MPKSGPVEAVRPILIPPPTEEGPPLVPFPMEEEADYSAKRTAAALIGGAGYVSCGTSSYDFGELPSVPPLPLP